jgi:hypothetical protein
MAGPRLLDRSGALGTYIPRGMERPTDPRDHIQELNEVLAVVLAPDERVDMVAPAIGSRLVLTDRRLLVVRDGANFRPTSGVRCFALDRDLRVRIGPQLKRVIIEPGGEQINLFILDYQLHAAERLLAEVRRRIHSR